MESTPKIDQWILANAEKLDLKVRLFQPPALAELGLFDAESSITIDGIKYTGRGTASDQTLAVRISFVEAVERLTLKLNDLPNSNGIAAHTSYFAAETAAKLELLERDLFLCHFLLRRPFVKYKTTLPEIVSCQNRLAGAGVCADFFILGKSEAHEVILCVINGRKASKPFGLICGSAAGLIGHATEKAFKEAIRSFAYVDDGDQISIQEFQLACENKTVKFSDHGNLALNLEYAAKFEEIFLIADLGDSFPTPRLDLLDDIRTRPLRIPSEIFGRTPLLFAAKATCEHAQSLFVGRTSDVALNMKRLEAFARDNGFAVTDINSMPHPFN